MLDFVRVGLEQKQRRCPKAIPPAIYPPYSVSIMNNRLCRCAIQGFEASVDNAGLRNRLCADNSDK